MPRTEIALMKGWRFALDAVGGRPDDSDFKPVCLPHDWAVLAPADEHAALGGAQGFFNRSAVGCIAARFELGRSLRAAAAGSNLAAFRKTVPSG